MLVEESIPHDCEIYLSVTLNRGNGTFEIISSNSGGLEVESLSTPIIKLIPPEGMNAELAESIAMRLGLEGFAKENLKSVLVSLE